MSDPTIPQRLHDSEINGSISWFFDAGFTAQIGDPLSGIKAEEQCGSLDEALAWLDAKARELYPAGYPTPIPVSPLGE